MTPAIACGIQIFFILSAERRQHAQLCSEGEAATKKAVAVLGLVIFCLHTVWQAPHNFRSHVNLHELPCDSWRTKPPDRSV
jgi:hypothetical protein